MAAETSYEGHLPSDIDFDELSYRITSRNEHPVVQYVRELPFESAVYPANMYHRLSDGSDGCRKGLITWCPPGHDQERPKRKGCGFIREKGSVGDEGIRYTACSDDKTHYARGRRSHCWSLHCPECMNDVALRAGTRVEEQLNAYRILTEKQGGDPGPLGHWVVSPPQKEAKRWVQTIGVFGALRKHVEGGLQDVEAKAGCLVFHPWRQTLQLLVYYLMCRRSDDRVLKGVSSFGMFNPRLNASYSLRANLIPSAIIDTVARDVIGYR